jgi:putative spermidine/putrescine transport system substrate-binding protein
MGIAVGTVIAVAACSPPSNENTSDAATATSVADLGGFDALVEAARAEGELNVIALPDTWANYEELKSTFESTYGITINDANPDGSSQDEINAVNQLKGTDRAPDVLDIGMAVALANADLFAPYQVQTWADIPDDQKEPTGLWFQDYGGYMSIGYDSAKVPAPSSVADLLKADYTSKVALNGDPTQSNSALNGVMMVNLAQGGTIDDISTGVDFFTQLNAAGNFVPVAASDSTVKNGTTQVVFDWDYLNTAQTEQVPTWKVMVPSDAILGGYYAQAINADAPHPAAARLWEEFCYSDQGQNLWLAGGARPVRMTAMTEAGTIDAALAATLPEVTGTPVFMDDDQATAAKTYLPSNWSQAIG